MQTVPIEDAIRSMHARKISAIMVTNSRKTVGIFTERDVVRSYIAGSGKSFKDMKVKDFMVSNLIVAVPDDELKRYLGHHGRKEHPASARVRE